VKCITFVSESFTRYSSNKTNVWQEILTPSTLPFSWEVVTKIMKIRLYFNICKSDGEKIQWHLFIWTWCTCPDKFGTK